MDNAKTYYQDENLTISYNLSMKGYWLILKEKSNPCIESFFISKIDFEKLKKSEDNQKFEKLKNLEKKFFSKIYTLKNSPLKLFNAIEVVKLKEEKEFEEFKKSNNL
jgi:hypothetical protein